MRVGFDDEGIRVEVFDGWFDTFHSEEFTATETVAGRMLLEGVVDDFVEGGAFRFDSWSSEEVVFELGSNTMRWIVVDWNGADWLALE